jgi:hypothetical protein
MATTTQVVSPNLVWLHNKGYGVYDIARGRVSKRARFAIADPYDDHDGFYLEGPDLLRLTEEAVNHLEESV